MSHQTLTLTNGDATAVINLVGAALVGLRFGAAVVIPETDLGPKVFAGTLLTPWPNRVEAGSYEFRGKRYQLEVRDGKNNALHGLVDEIQFQVVTQSVGFLKLQTELLPTAGYPWRLGVEVEFELSDVEITIAYLVTNLSDTEAPVGIGSHPYFPYAEDTRIEIAAQSVAVHGSNMIPIGEVSSREIGLGPGQKPRVVDLKLDSQFSALGDPVASLSYEHFGIDIWQEDAKWLMVYNTEDFPWATGHGRAIAIEPQTCPANAFNTGEGLRALAKDESTSMRWGVRLQG